MLQIGVEEHHHLQQDSCERGEDGTGLYSTPRERLLDLFSGGGETKFHIMHDRDDPWPPDFKPPDNYHILYSNSPNRNVPAPDFTVPEAWLKSQTGGVVIELGYKTLDTPLLKASQDGGFGEGGSRWMD